ncbi:MAG: sugar ABC transporter ATP-binding protein [Pirellulaceae bacterium]
MTAADEGSGASDDTPVFLLEAQGISKSFAEPVLEDVSIQVREGEIVALLGANGAGKSTLCRILSGLLEADNGQLLWRGKRLSLASKSEAQRAGIQFVQQELNSIDNLSVAENLHIGRMPTIGGCWIDQARLRLGAIRALERVGLGQLDPATSMERLGVGQKQLVEIAAALDRNAELLLLDEPTAALTPWETRSLFDRLKELRLQGVGMIYVSHRLDEVLKLCDRAVILRDGRIHDSVTLQGMTENQLLHRLTGHPVSADSAPKGQPQVRATPSRVTRLGDERMRVEGWTRNGFFRDLSLVVHAGQCVGIAGLIGSGRTELLRSIFGADGTDDGRLTIEGKRLDRPFRTPAEAVEHGLAFVPEDRKAQSLLLTQSLRDNILLASWSRLHVRGWVDSEEERRVAERWVEAMGIRARSTDQSAATLSGGNQQKLVLARWMERNPAILLLDEPTRGIDQGSRTQIRQTVSDLKQNGCGVILVDSDLEELMSWSDRIVVLSGGRFVSEFSRDQFSRNVLEKACFEGVVQGG